MPILATPILSAPGTRPIEAPPSPAVPGDPNKVILDQMCNMFGDLSSRLGNMENNLGGRLDCVESGHESRFAGIEDKIESKFTHVTAVVGGVSKKVDGLKERLDKNNLELEGRIKKVLDRKVRGDRENIPPAMRSRIRGLPLAVNGPVMPSSEALNAPSLGPGPGSRLAENYWRARRSIQLLPMTGSCIVKGALDFIENELCLGSDVCDLRPGNVVRVRPNCEGRARGEVAVTFPDIETHDLVRSSAKNLAGKSNMGMHLEITEHLRPSLRNLESVSFVLKKTVPEMKRNIKFDDAYMDLVLDVKLGEDRPWQKIRPENARAARWNPRLDEAGNQEGPLGH